MPGHYGNGNGGRNRRMATTRNQPTRRNLGTNGNAINENPVTRLFNAPRTPRYYNPDGSLVPVGAPLHEHQDGTIMTQHGMGPNDNSFVVTTRQMNQRTVNRQPVSRVRATQMRTTQRQANQRRGTRRRTTQMPQNGTQMTQNRTRQAAASRGPANPRQVTETPASQPRVTRRTTSRPAMRRGRTGGGGY